MKSLVLFAVISIALSGQAFAQQKCKPVVGNFEAVVVLPPACMAAFCTAGRVWGGIQGTYTFAMTMPPVPSGALPSIFFFTGQSQITTKGNELLFGTDTGTLDLGPNAGFASLITFTGGTGSMAGATGQIRLRGELGEGTSGDYIGTLCTP